MKNKYLHDLSVPPHKSLANLPKGPEQLYSKGAPWMTPQPSDQVNILRNMTNLHPVFALPGCTKTQAASPLQYPCRNAQPASCHEKTSDRPEVRNIL